MRNLPLALTLISAFTMTMACAKESGSPHPAKPATPPSAQNAPSSPAPSASATPAPGPSTTSEPNQPTEVEAMDFTIRGTLQLPYSKLNKKHAVDIAAATYNIHDTDLVFQDGKLYGMLDILALRDGKGEPAVEALLENSCVIRIPECDASADCSKDPIKLRDTTLKLNYEVHIFNALAAMDIPGGNDPNKTYNAKENYGSEPLNGTGGFYQISCEMDKTLHLTDSLAAYTPEATLKQHFGNLLKVDVVKPAATR